MSEALKTASLPRTTAEFLVWPGDGRAKRYQLVDGEVRAMAPTRPTHGLIQATLTFLIQQRLGEIGSRCRVVVAGAVVPRVRSNDNVRIPDLVVTCSPVGATEAVVPEPVLLVEILSPSNAADTWANVWAYATIPSVQEILVIHSVRVKAHRLRRLSDGTWPEVPEDLDGSGILRLDTVDLTRDVAALYEGTHFA